MEEDLYQFDGFEGQDPEPVNDPSFYDEGADDHYEETEFENNSDAESDYITQLLESRGIKNRTIQITNEAGELEEINFDDLTDAEKFDILSEVDQPVMPEDHEIEMINYLRKNNMSLQDFAEWQRQLGVQEYLNNQVKVTEFDNYSDDEMIAYDFIQRFGEDMSDEEIDAEIERLREDPEAYEKRVALLRNTYKTEEEAQQRFYQEQEAQQSQAAVANFQGAYIDAARGLNYIQGMNLEDYDKQELLQFVLAKDAAGRTGLSQALNDPDAVLRMAWFLLHGEEAFEATSQYYKDQISQRRPARAVTRQRSQSKDAFKF